jgi:divalent metal cation (Fe/Co/Zn/Cd) transporter
MSADGTSVSEPAAAPAAVTGTQTVPIAALLSPETRARLYARATQLAVFTIGYNVIEGLVSVFFGLQDDTVALFGFGLDSFVEVISGVGIWHMLRRLRASADGDGVDAFEKTALRVTGTAFYLLTGGLILTAVGNLLSARAPETTFWGIVVAGVSIVTMWLLIRLKLAVGRALGSAAIVADANCTRACLALSFVLLASSLGYAATGIRHIDTLGALVIAALAWREGRESFEKSRGGTCGCGGSCGG